MRCAAAVYTIVIPFNDKLAHNAESPNCTIRNMTNTEKTLNQGYHLIEGDAERQRAEYQSAIDNRFPLKSIFSSSVTVKCGDCVSVYV